MIAKLGSAFESRSNVSCLGRLHGFISPTLTTNHGVEKEFLGPQSCVYPHVGERGWCQMGY